ncbi:MAG: hypothetical protein HQL79_07490 [Magnetococcales bacterium]|nr:hypothetical protein [Magnetococcales bacterium]
MFKIQGQHSVSWPVVVKIPANGGRFTKAEFQADFLMIDQERIDAIMNAPEIPTSIDVTFLSEVVVGFANVQGEDGSELSFSKEALGVLLGIPYVRSAMIDAFFACVSGGRRKN